MAAMVARVQEHAGEPEKERARGKRGKRGRELRGTEQRLQEVVSAFGRQAGGGRMGHLGASTQELACWR
jgi:hypothetical protein